MRTQLVVFNRLEARLQPNIGFTLLGQLAVFTRSAITPPKVNRFGWNLDHSEYIVCDWPWQMLGDTLNSDSLGARRNCCLCQVNNARFHRFHWFPVGQIPRHLNTTRRSVSRWNFGTEFWEFYRKGPFFQKSTTFSKIFNILQLQTAITLLWLQIAGNSLPK